MACPRRAAPAVGSAGAAACTLVVLCGHRGRQRRRCRAALRLRAQAPEGRGRGGAGSQATAAAAELATPRHVVSEKRHRDVEHREASGSHVAASSESPTRPGPVAVVEPPARAGEDQEEEEGEEGALPMEDFGHDEPSNAWGLGSRVFSRELDELLAAMRGGPAALRELGEELTRVLGRAEVPPRPGPPAFVEELTLDLDEVIKREDERGVPSSTPFVKAIFFVLCWTLDRVYEGRPIPKFWVLETVARLPYFSYITVLHLYESLGWWRTPQLRLVHNAEEDNELHHLLIMESLGGNCAWFDRFLAQHAALLYYWVVVALFVADPRLAYNFSLLVEEHAFVTYAQFVEENRHILEKVPAPPVAVSYYCTGDLYFFDKFQSSRSRDLPPRRPPCSTLLDVFENIRDDEHEHVLTMRACQDWWGGAGSSPLHSSESETLGARSDWRRWAAEVAALERRPEKPGGSGGGE